MSQYQGRALDRRPARATGRRGAARVALRAGIFVALVAGLACVPWRTLRHRYAVLQGVRVTGLRYLDAARIRRDARLAEGQDLLALDLAKVRQLVMLDPRVAGIQVRRHGLRWLELRVTERVPVLAVPHGEPWEIDTSGVLLEPLQRGVVADVPLLTGAGVERWRAGTQVGTARVQRGLAWAAVLGDNALRLAGQVSEVDVSEERTTRLVLMDGVRVIAPAWPSTVRQLSGLRATLLDLANQGTKPTEVDVRIPEQIIVRDLRPVASAAPPGPAQGTS